MGQGLSYPNNDGSVPDWVKRERRAQGAKGHGESIAEGIADILERNRRNDRP